MHEPVKDSLEEYLRGGNQFPDVEAHLKSCAECRTEVSAMQRQAGMLQSLRSPHEVEPNAGFYSRVMNRIESQARPSVWNLFGESLFAKRLVYASTVLVVLLGTFLVSSSTTGSEPQQAVLVSSPEVMLAGDTEQFPPPITMENPQRDREVVLVNLATYQQNFQ